MGVGPIDEGEVSMPASIDIAYNMGPRTRQACHGHGPAAPRASCHRLTASLPRKDAPRFQLRPWGRIIGDKFLVTPSLHFQFHDVREFREKHLQKLALVIFAKATDSFPNGL
mmetsp:Transcript_2385/g.4093  ORF Transcript_2385/g.4093 Transcript_2385/m.4093 type:complete len:112 (-) Transcript_2385:45-380(-)